MVWSTAKPWDCCSTALFYEHLNKYWVCVRCNKVQKWHLNSNKIKQATPACSELKGSLFSKMFEQSMEHDKRTRTLWQCQVIKYVVLSKRWMSRKKSATQKRVEREKTFTFRCYQSYFEKQLCDVLLTTIPIHSMFDW